MAKRKKNGSKQHSDPVRMARRFLERNDYRQALKHARVAFRKSPADETKQLLDQISLARADELLRTGHFDQAKDLLSPLANASCNSKIKKKLPELLLRAGLVDQFPEYRGAVSDSDRREFESDSFDRAVAILDRARNKDDREQAELVRRALEAVETGEDDRAFEFLRGIPRKSLAADWRYFVRGLIAWYRNDHDAVTANWTCLAPDRAASRIVARLTEGTEPSGLDHPADHDNLSAKTATFGVRSSALLPLSVVNSVPELRSMEGLQRILLELANEDWESVSKSLQECRSVLQQGAPDLLDRIAGKIVSRMIQADDEDALNEFCRRVKPPQNDPNWHRARATLSQMQFEDLYEDLVTAENRWLQCLRDIDHIGQFSDSEREIARSLVGTRVAGLSRFEIEGLDQCSCGDCHKDEIAQLKERAIEFLEIAIAACPDCVDPWRELVELHQVVDDPIERINVLRRMLEKFPNDLDAILAAAKYESEDGDPLQNRDYLLRAIRIMPLDDRLRAQVMMAHRECARSFIRGAEFESARIELEAAVAIDNGNELYQVNHLVLFAALELAAEKDVAAERLIEDALNAYAEPTPVYLDLAIEATNVNLPDTIIRRFEDAWRSRLGKKCHSQTAGQMARLISPGATGLTPENEEYTPEVLEFIKRSNRVRFKRTDLGAVCVFLQFAKESALVEKYVQKGRKSFPDDPFFHLVAAEMELAKGPYDCRRKFAFAAYTKVLEICDQSPDASYLRMVETARCGLTFLSEMGLKKPIKPRFSPAFLGSDPPQNEEEFKQVVERIAEESGMDVEDVLKEIISEVSAESR